MVCLGNICRSPLAEGILRSKLPKTHFFIDSAGTSGFHNGSPPDPRSIEVAQKNGINIDYQKSRPFRANDFESFDLIFVKTPSKPKHDFVVGEDVRMDDGRAIGSIDKIEKGKATVNYGLFTTKVSLERLEYVESKK